MEKRIKLYGKQHDFFTCTDKVAAFIGGIRSGKTYSGCLWMLSQTTPGKLNLVVAPTYPMLRDVTWRTMLDIGGNIFGVNKSEMALTVPGGGEMLFRSADTPDRIRGITANNALIDEAGYCPSDTYDIVKGRLSGEPGLLRIVTTPKGRNWLYDRQGEMTVFRAATQDNPYLPKDYISGLKSSYTGNFARQELYGEFVAFEGLVYPMFSREIHVRRMAEDWQPARWLMCQDEGYTNPAVILLVGEDNDGRWHVAREWYERGKLQAEVVRVAREWQLEKRVNLDAVDEAGAGLIADLKNTGVPAVGAKGRVLDGIQAIQNRLQLQGDGLPRLTIDPACINLINEFESYAWKPEKDEPIKENDHALDALRYLDNANAPVQIFV